MYNPDLIAEVGGNHEGDFEYAKILCKLASETTSHVVKLQLYRAKSLVNPIYSSDRYKHFQKFELTKDQYQYLSKQIVDSGKEFMASIWDVEMLDWVDEYIQRYKIGSGDLTAYKLIKEFCLRGKPIIISTGLSSLEQVKNLVQYIYSLNSDYKNFGMLTILQCTSMYPIPHSDANLNVMHTLRDNFNHPYGYSDHTRGTEALELATVLGASVLEFHFTDSRTNKTFRDHLVSLTPNEVCALSKKILTYNDLLGSYVKSPQPIEIETNHTITFRRGIYPNRDLKKGHKLLEDDLVELRPIEGLPSEEFPNLIGKVLTADVRYLQSLHSGLFE